MLDDSADGPMHTRRPGWRQSGIYQPVSACSLHVLCSWVLSVADHLSPCRLHLLKTAAASVRWLLLCASNPVWLPAA